MVSENIILFVYARCIYVEYFRRLHLKLEISNSAMNKVTGIKCVLAQANKILNLSLNIHIQNHLVEGSCEKIYIQGVHWQMRKSDALLTGFSSSRFPSKKDLIVNFLLRIFFPQMPNIRQYR